MDRNREPCTSTQAKDRRRYPQQLQLNRRLDDTIDRFLSDPLRFVRVVVVLAYCHFSVTILCVNVAFDLLVCGLPLVVLRTVGIVSAAQFTRWATCVIHWTTPIVYAMPLVFSGTKVYCNHVGVDLLERATNHATQSNDHDHDHNNSSLFLGNHGSRVDWMLAMACGHRKRLRGRRHRTGPTEEGEIPLSTTTTTTKRPRARVGFVCERLIQYMPLVGWYRAWVCEDVFVQRSFADDASIIRTNIQHFRAADVPRMLFLSPEGVVVDFDEQSQRYIEDCRAYCRRYGYEPFNYVLTPRHKGFSCFVDQVRGEPRRQVQAQVHAQAQPRESAENENENHNDNDHSVHKDVDAEGGSQEPTMGTSMGPIVSVCMVYVREGKLLNCQLSSPDRVVADIYLLNEGVFGKPVDVYLVMRPLPIPHDFDFDASQDTDTDTDTDTNADTNALRTLLMDDNQWKDEVVAKFDRLLTARQCEHGRGHRHGSSSLLPDDDFSRWIQSHFTVIIGNESDDVSEEVLSHLGHAALILLTTSTLGVWDSFVVAFQALYLLVAFLHTLGWILNQHNQSTESVPCSSPALLNFLPFLLKIPYSLPC